MCIYICLVSERKYVSFFKLPNEKWNNILTHNKMKTKVSCEILQFEIYFCLYSNVYNNLMNRADLCQD